MRKTGILFVLCGLAVVCRGGTQADARTGREAGTPSGVQAGAPAPTPAPMTAQLKVMSFNIRKSGEKTGYRAQPFAALISEYLPDLVALQEVDFRVTRSGNRDFLTELADLTGMFPVFAKAIETGGGEYGVAVLSKYPPESSAIEELPFPEGAKEKRVALVCTVSFPDGFRLRFASTHLDQSSEEVRLQMAAGLNGGALSPGALPAVIGGDFNARPFESTIAAGMRRWKLLGDNRNTFPASGPSSKIDYLFGYPADRWETNAYEVMPVTISDHCALVAEIVYSAPATERP